MQQVPTTPNVVGFCWPTMLHLLHEPKTLTSFKLYATSANTVVAPCKQRQQVTTLLGPTMLGVVGQQCWIRLHGPLSNDGRERQRECYKTIDLITEYNHFM